MGGVITEKSLLVSHILGRFWLSNRKYASRSDEDTSHDGSREKRVKLPANSSISAFDLEIRQSRLQVRNPRVEDFRVCYSQTLQGLQRLQMLEACIRDLSIVESENDQFVQTRQMLQSGVRHLRVVQPKRRPAFRLTELLQALIRQTR